MTGKEYAKFFGANGKPLEVNMQHSVKTKDVEEKNETEKEETQKVVFQLQILGLEITIVKKLTPKEDAQYRSN